MERELDKTEEDRSRAGSWGQGSGSHLSTHPRPAVAYVSLQEGCPASGSLPSLLRDVREEAVPSAHIGPPTLGYTWPSVTSGPFQARGPHRRCTGEGEALARWLDQPLGEGVAEATLG